MNEINLKNGGGTEQYRKPQMEVVDLSGENVIVTSVTGCSGGVLSYGGGSGGCTTDSPR